MPVFPVVCCVKCAVIGAVSCAAGVLAWRLLEGKELRYRIVGTTVAALGTGLFLSTGAPRALVKAPTATPPPTL